MAAGAHIQPSPLQVHVGTYPTLACLASAMNLSDTSVTARVPPFASALAIELHKTGGNYSIALVGLCLGSELRLGLGWDQGRGRGRVGVASSG